MKLISWNSVSPKIISNEEFYKQKDGSEMRSPLGSLKAEMFMSNLNQLLQNEFSSSIVIRHIITQ